MYLNKASKINNFIWLGQVVLCITRATLHVLHIDSNTIKSDI